MEELQGYVKKKRKFYKDVTPLFAKDMVEPAVTRQVAPAKVKVSKELKVDETDEVIWREELKAYVQRGQFLVGNLVTIHPVIWGQCSEAMKVKVKQSMLQGLRRKDKGVQLFLVAKASQQGRDTSIL